jgi:hypothetical protein
MRWVLSLVFVIGLFVGSRAETVTPKYWDSAIPLDSFACDWISRSSFINRVCYDQPNAYMIVLLKETYYHYCDIDPATVTEFKSADSMGRYYNSHIKGHFDCRSGHVPAY